MSYGKLPSGACGLIRSLRVSRLANRHDTESDISMLIDPLLVLLVSVRMLVRGR